MLDVAQVGQVGKTHLLLDMHRLRKRVFKDRMGWDVTISPGGLEIDAYDLPTAIYLLALGDNRKVIGSWRLLPCDGPTMIRELWPDFLDSLPMPRDPLVWEASRFAVDHAEDSSTEDSAAEDSAAEHSIQISAATQELFCGLIELGLRLGIKEVFTMYDARIARLLKRLRCKPRRLSEKKMIDDHAAAVGCFDINAQTLECLRAATGIGQELITDAMARSLILPPVGALKEG